ncbi:MAG: DUF3486 family protein [Bradyrhizobium sp.]|nr:DUF3486 family protein [Bradyrhizobium sp.]
MARKNSIVRLAAPVKAAIDTALKRDQFTLDEILDYLRPEYPSERLPSRSALGRYKLHFDRKQKGICGAPLRANVLAKRLVEILEGAHGAAIQEALTTRKVVRVIVLEFSDEDTAESVSTSQGVV